MRVTRFLLPALIVLFAFATVAVGLGPRFRTELYGRSEVPPVETEGDGFATFQVTDDGKAIRFLVNVSELSSPIIQAHIHLAPKGVNGPVIAFLANFGPLPGNIGVDADGRLVESYITEANLVGATGPKTLDALLDEINSGNVYVNVHTVNYPGGEVRGQLGR